MALLLSSVRSGTCSRDFISVADVLFLFQASGVTVSDACKTTYEEIKKDKKHRYVVFYIKDEKQIDVEVIGKQLRILSSLQFNTWNIHHFSAYNCP